MKVVIIKGAMRSGTNWLSEVIERNFRNVTVADRNKHLGNIPNQKFLIITKHPLAWWLSYWKWKTHPLWDQPRKIWMKANDLIGRTIPHYYNRKAIHDLKMLTGYWNAWDEEYSCWIRYEDLLTDLESQLEIISIFMNIERSSFDPVTNTVDDAGRTLSYDFDKTRYTEEKWIQDYTNLDIQRILNPLNKTNAIEELEAPGYDLKRFL